MDLCAAAPNELVPWDAKAANPLTLAPLPNVPAAAGCGDAVDAPNEDEPKVDFPKDDWPNEDCPKPGCSKAGFALDATKPD